MNLVLKICKIGQKQGINFDELPCITAKLTFAFLMFLSSFISFKSVGTKEMTIVHSFLPFRELVKQKGITKCPKTTICIPSFI